MILIIYTTNTVIMVTTVIIWGNLQIKKKKDNTIEIPVFRDIIKVLILRDFRMRFNFITVQNTCRTKTRNNKRNFYFNRTKQYF